MKANKYILEACVEGIEQAERAEKQGADRIELCASLVEDGLTPDVEIIKSAYDNLSIPIRVIIRPRAGDFNYSLQEVEQMKESIHICKEIGVEGVVIGATIDDVQLDIPLIKELANLASPLKVTIHKAIDIVADPLKEIDKLLQINEIDAVLTSGGADTCLEGMDVIKTMIDRAGQALEIIACGKVTKDNVDTLHQNLLSRAYHGKLIVGKLT